MTDRLLAGISHDLGRGEALGCGELRNRFEVAYAPGGIAPPEVAVEGLVAGRRVPAVAAIGAVEIEKTVVRQDAGRTGDQADRRRPWRDMDHVAAEHGIRLLDRPGRRLGIERHCRPDV